MTGAEIWLRQAVFWKRELTGGASKRQRTLVRNPVMSEVGPPISSSRSSMLMWAARDRHPNLFDQALRVPRRMRCQRRQRAISAARGCHRQRRARSRTEKMAHSRRSVEMTAGDMHQAARLALGRLLTRTCQVKPSRPRPRAHEIDVMDADKSDLRRVTGTRGPTSVAPDSRTQSVRGRIRRDPRPGDRAVVARGNSSSTRLRSLCGARTAVSVARINKGRGPCGLWQF